jgi:hypothetical protein
VRGVYSNGQIDEDTVVKRATTGANNLRVKVEKAPGGGSRVTMSGTIDENSDLDAAFSKLSGDMVINMKDVERVNSMGVHLWIPVMARLSANHRVVVEEISYAFVFNANAVANLFGSAQVVSCTAPYYCAKCKDHVMVKVTVDEVAAAGGAPPQKRCARCTAAMEFDELDGYFSFFKTRAAS